MQVDNDLIRVNVDDAMVGDWVRWREYYGEGDDYHEHIGQIESRGSDTYYRWLYTKQGYVYLYNSANCVITKHGVSFFDCVNKYDIIGISNFMVCVVDINDSIIAMRVLSHDDMMIYFNKESKKLIFDHVEFVAKPKSYLLANESLLKVFG